MPDVTFTINGISYTLQPTAYTLLVRTASLFCTSQGLPHEPTTSSFRRLHSGRVDPEPPSHFSCTEVAFLLERMTLSVVGRPPAWFSLNSYPAMEQQQTLDKPLSDVF